MRIMHVVGARPNLMKVAPVMSAMGERPEFQQELIHTGQHYDSNMSDVFFQELGIPKPDVNLGVGSGSHAQQTAEVMIRLEQIVLDHKPDLVVGYGDVNSTAAAAIVCSKLLVPLAHVEAGLRSFDRSMPEEINRLITDQLAELLFTPSSDGDTNLAREGIPAGRIHLVGNVMIDTLVRLRPQADAQWQTPAFDRWRDRRYVLVTMHRPSNVDDPVMLRDCVNALREFARDASILWPVHPRTRQRMQQLGLTGDGLDLAEPLGYLQFLALQSKALAVITDSGGIQEETTYLGVPCITVRENTERPVTVTLGTNTLVGRDMSALKREFAAILAGTRKRGGPVPLWDGRASQRIADIVSQWAAGRKLMRPALAS
jgi:UDP-N-acetylglucosamine 2-epimerase (non-hydrolysing)